MMLTGSAWLMAALCVSALAVHRPPWPIMLMPQGLGDPALGAMLTAWLRHAAVAGAVLAWVAALGGWGAPALRWLAPVWLEPAARRHTGRGLGFLLLGLAVLAAGWCGLLAAGPLAALALLPVAVFRRVPWGRPERLAVASWPWPVLDGVPVLAALPAMFAPEV